MTWLLILVRVPFCLRLGVTWRSVLPPFWCDLALHFFGLRFGESIFGLRFGESFFGLRSGVTLLFIYGLRFGESFFDLCFGVTWLFNLASVLVGVFLASVLVLLGS